MSCYNLGLVTSWRFFINCLANSKSISVHINPSLHRPVNWVLTMHYIILYSGKKELHQRSGLKLYLPLENVEVRLVLMLLSWY